MPVIIGLFIIGVINGMSKAMRGRYAPILWDLATVGVVINSSLMFWKDIGSDLIDTGAQPFTSLVIYGGCSIFFIFILAFVEAGKESAASTQETGETGKHSTAVPSGRKRYGFKKNGIYKRRKHKGRKNGPLFLK